MTGYIYFNFRQYFSFLRIKREHCKISNAHKLDLYKINVLTVVFQNTNQIEIIQSLEQVDFNFNF